MLIDWFTVGAQIVNFIVLVWLLRHFLYKPILTAIETREGRIAKEQADAALERSLARQERDDLERKRQAFDAERGALLASAIADAEREKTRLLMEAKHAADSAHASELNSRQRELADLQQAMVRLISEEVFSVARSALADLGSVELQESIARTFVARLDTLPPDVKHLFDHALRSPDVSPVVRSRYDLADSKAIIQAGIDKAFQLHVPLTFEISPDVICGIELSAQGQKVAWTIAEYLSALQNRLGALLPGSMAAAPASSLAAPPGPPVTGATTS